MAVVVAMLITALIAVVIAVLIAVLIAMQEKQPHRLDSPVRHLVFPALRALGVARCCSTSATPVCDS
jgi:ABC-type phosphate transport system permease subunit